MSTSFIVDDEELKLWLKDIRSLRVAGDVEGHPFYGNQWGSKGASLGVAPRPFTLRHERLETEEGAQAEFERAITEQYPDGLTVYHESPLENLDSLKKEGLYENSFATIGKPSDYVTAKHKVIVEIKLTPKESKGVSPDMAFTPEQDAPGENRYANLLRKHNGVYGADISINTDQLPPHRLTIRSLGDIEGHEFHGNQWSGGGTFYHGTAKTRLNQILREGIKSGRNSVVGDAQAGQVYITNSLEDAKMWATIAASKLAHEARRTRGSFFTEPARVAAILRVEVPVSESGKLRPDDNMHYSQDEVPELFQFAGDIPPSWIKGVIEGRLPDGVDFKNIRRGQPDKVSWGDERVRRMRTLEAVRTLWIVVDLSPEEARNLGGPGSGNFGHAGRPGEIGGSAPSLELTGVGPDGQPTKYAIWKAKQEAKKSGEPVTAKPTTGKPPTKYAIWKQKQEAKKSGRAPETIDLEKLRPTPETKPAKNHDEQVNRSIRDLQYQRLEVLHIINENGKIISEVQGSKHRVPVRGENYRMLKDPSSKLTYVHNHPAESSLSAADLNLAAYPGLKTIHAVTTNGSEFSATVNQPHNIRQASNRLRREAINATGVHAYTREDDFYMVIGHMINQSLHQSGRITYKAKLGPRMQTAMDRSPHVATIKRAFGLK